MADISKPPMALFANIPAANIKKSNIIMFAMVSSRYLVAPNEWPPERGPMFKGSISICLQPDVIFDVFDHTKWLMAVGGGSLWGVFW